MATNKFVSTAKTRIQHIERAAAVIPAGMDFRFAAAFRWWRFAYHRLMAPNPFRDKLPPNEWAKTGLVVIG